LRKNLDKEENKTSSTLDRSDEAPRTELPQELLPKTASLVQSKIPIAEPMFLQPSISYYQSQFLPVTTLSSHKKMPGLKAISNQNLGAINQQTTLKKKIIRNLESKKDEINIRLEEITKDMQNLREIKSGLRSAHKEAAESLSSSGNKSQLIKGNEREQKNGMESYTVQLGSYKFKFPLRSSKIR